MTDSGGRKEPHFKQGILRAAEWLSPDHHSIGAVAMIMFLIAFICRSWYMLAAAGCYLVLPLTVSGGRVSRMAPGLLVCLLVLGVGGLALAAYIVLLLHTLTGWG